MTVILPDRLTNTTCLADSTWAPGVAIRGVDDTGTKHFLAVTPDERALVWTEQSKPITTLAIASRSTPDEPFGIALRYLLPPTYGSDGYVALRPDARELLFTNSDHTGLGSVKRSSLDSPFESSVTVAGFSTINASLETSSTLYSPIFSPSGTTIFYIIQDSSGASALHKSRYQTVTEKWSGTFPVNAPSLETSPAQDRFSLVGITNDENGFFTVSQATNETKLVWIVPPKVDVTDRPFIDLGLQGIVQVNATCTRRYFTETTGQGARLRVSSVMKLVIVANPVDARPPRPRAKAFTCPWFFPGLRKYHRRDEARSRA